MEDLKQILLIVQIWFVCHAVGRLISIDTKKAREERLRQWRMQYRAMRDKRTTPI